MTGLKRLLIVLGLMVAPAIAFSQEQQDLAFRIGIATVPEGCHSAKSEHLDAVLKAYAKHLEGRLGVAVELCRVETGSAKDALSSGKVDFTRVTVATPELGQKTIAAIRPILTPRPSGHVGRTEFVIIGPSQAAPIDGDTPDFQSVTPIAANATEIQALSAILSRDASSIQPSTDIPTTINAVFDGEDADSVAALNAGRHAIYCQEKPDACEDLHILWRGFAPLGNAWSVRTTMDKERLYRLIGIHAVLHKEQPEIFKTLVGHDSEAFEPTEPWAFAYRNTLKK